MFSNRKAIYVGNEKVLVDSVCLSTDTKPTDGIANGSICLEMNTGKIYAFNEENGEWEEVSGSGGGGGSGGVIIATIKDGAIQYSFNELWAYVNNGYMVYYEDEDSADFCRIPLSSLTGDTGDDLYAVFGNATFTQSDPDAPMVID